MPITRYCVICGRAATHGARCPQHALAAAPRPPQSQRRPGYTAAERRRRKATVEAHRAVFGNWCPGLPGKRLAHDVIAPNILTAEHPEAVAAGGAEGQRLTVLCRSCNSSKGAR